MMLVGGGNALNELGTQDWSNGNVGMIGKSYDGSTPWEAAMYGNPEGMENLFFLVPPTTAIMAWFVLGEELYRNDFAFIRKGNAKRSKKK